MYITVILTEKCNLNCSYCLCNKTFQGRLNFSIAKKAIISLIAKKTPSDNELNILFLGGEPFLEFDLMKKLIGYFSIKYSNMQCNYKIVTNGTLVKGEIQEWITSLDQNLKLTLSIDGDKSTQNYLRDKSFELIDLDFFKSNKNYSEANMVIVPETIHKIAQNISCLEKKGFYVKAVLADGIDWSGQSNSSILIEQLKLLIDHYIENLEIVPCSLLSMATQIAGSDKFQCCHAGENSFTIDTSGLIYSCQRSTPYYNGGKWSIPQKNLSLINVGYFCSDCESCIARDICNVCPASIASIQSDAIQAKAKCSLFKIILRANAIFHATLLSKYKHHIFIRNKNNEQIRQMAKGCQSIIYKLQ